MVVHIGKGQQSITKDFLLKWVKFNDCRGWIWRMLTVIRCYQLSSVVIRCNQNASKSIQKHVKMHQRYVRMHQKKPVFLIKYCHNKGGILANLVCVLRRVSIADSG